MGVKYYIFGNEAGQPATTGSGGIPGDASYGPGEQFEYVLGAAIQTVTFSSSTKQISLKNMDDTNALEYRFGAETEWFLLGPYGQIKESISVSSMEIRRVAGTPTVEVVAILQ